MKRLHEKLADFPVMAILRGLQPEDAAQTGRLLIDAGIGAIEVPLNRPLALESIKILVELYGEEASIGAGTVTAVKQVEDIHQIGAKFAVSPNCNPEIIKKTKSLGLYSIPGVVTPTEIYIATENGADILKFFPCDLLTPKMIMAMAVIIPSHMPFICVGGINADNMKAYIEAGASGFGVGSELYKMGMTAQEIKQKAEGLKRAIKL